MKNFKKSFIALMVAVPTLFTACSEPEVSDEVAALRQTQADLLAQRVEKQRLDNALQALENARDSAQFAAEIAQANLDVQTAIDDLTDYLRTRGLEDAAEHLANYGKAQDDANDVLGQIIAKEAMIAEMELLIGAENPDGMPGDSISFELAAEIIQRDLDELNATLAAQEAALASLEAVEADPATAQEEVNELVTQIQDLENQNLALMVEIEKAQQTADAASNALDATKTAIDEYNVEIAKLAEAQQNVTDKENEIETLQDAITVLNELLVQQNASLGVRQQVLNDAEAALAPYLAAISASEADVAAAENAENAAQAAFNIVNNDFANDNATQAELDAAQAALDSAQTALADAQQALADAEAEAVGPQNLYNVALGNRDTEQGKVNDTIQNIATSNSELLILQNQLVELQQELTDILNLEPPIDEESLAALEDAAEAAQDVVDGLQDEYDANDDMVNNLENVIDVLENQLEGINDAINDLKDDIEDTKASVEQKQKMLDDNTISEAEWLAEIAREQAELERLNAEYQAHLALAASYLAAYNAALNQAG